MRTEFRRRRRFTPSEEKEHADLASALRQQHPGRPVSHLLEILAKVHHAEMEVIGRAPNFSVFGMGAALGIDRDEINRINSVGQDRAAKMRQLKVGGRCTAGNQRTFRYVMEDGTVKEAR